MNPESSNIIWSRAKDGTHHLKFVHATGEVEFDLKEPIDRQTYLRLCSVVSAMAEGRAKAILAERAGMN